MIKIQFNCQFIGFINLQLFFWQSFDLISMHLKYNLVTNHQKLLQQNIIKIYYFSNFQMINQYHLVDILNVQKEHL